MAVDYSVPLITDIKCTKLLVEVSNKIFVYFLKIVHGKLSPSLFQGTLMMWSCQL